MSIDRALNIIDGLLEVLDEADKRAAAKGGAVEEKKVEAPTEQKTGAPVGCFSADVDAEDLEGRTVRITSSLPHLEAAWKEAELGANDELAAFLGHVGKVTDSEDDGTLQIQWGNFDTCWVPLTACMDAKGAKPTIPGIANSWLSGEAEEKKEAPEEKKEAVSVGPLLKSVEDPCVQERNTLIVTTDLAVLTRAWAEAELGPNDELDSYLGVIGMITEIEEDDDTVQLRWENMDTVWIPVQACADARGAKPTLPGTVVSWLA